jgi:hypothetical protein
LCAIQVRASNPQKRSVKTRFVMAGGSAARILRKLLGRFRLVTGMGVILMASHASAGDYCDPGIPVDKTDPLAYRNRGERCEGLYIRQVVGEPLEIVGFTDGRDPTLVSKDSPLMIKWSHAGNEEVHLRAVSSRPRTYYRMDTVCPPGREEFNWPTDVLTQTKLSPSEIAVCGWFEKAISRGQQLTIYVPLSITASSSAETALKVSDHYEIVLLPALELQQVFITLCPFENDTVGRPLRDFDEKDLAYGYYPAEKPFRIEIPISLLTAQSYYFSIGASLANGGSASVEGYFVRSPSR